MTAELRISHTADLAPRTRRAIRRLLDGVFPTMNDDAFQNMLGGLHAMLYEGKDLIGHACVVQRRLLHGDESLRTGYVEGVAVRADRRRQGHGSTLMAALEPIVRNAYQLGALGASPDGARLYTSRGWQLWRGTASAFTPEGILRTPGQDGCIYVLPVEGHLDLTGDLICDWRHGGLW